MKFVNGVLVCGLLSLSMSALAGSTTDAAIGGAVGGAVGAAVGNEVGGREGAIVGGAIGAATGTAITTKGDERHDGHYDHDDDHYRRVERDHDDDHHHHGSSFCPPGQAKKGRCRSGRAGLCLIAVGVIGQVGAQPALQLTDRHALALGQRFDLVAADLADAEVA